MLRDMRGPEGGFYSAENADSLIETGKPELAEAAFYVWTAGQIRGVLGDDRAALFNFHYGVEPSGNVPAPQDIQGELKGKNVLIVRHTLAETAVKFKKSEDAVRVALSEAREKLAAARAGRPRPSLDDKVLVRWNGLMISAFARAAQVLDEARYLEAAQAAAGFIESRMYDANANLLKRRYREGQVDIDAVLEDYAFLIQGLLDLYETSFYVKWLSWVVRLRAQQDTLFSPRRQPEGQPSDRVHLRELRVPVTNGGSRHCGEALGRHLETRIVRMNRSSGNKTRVLKRHEHFCP